MDAVEQSYSTSDAILAITLFLAGCEPVDIRQPCTNLFDADILKKLGYGGEKIGEAADQAWRDGKKGHVQFHLKLTERAQFLIKAHRDQMEKIEKGEGTAFKMLAAIVEEFSAGAMAVDELIMRTACVNLKTRGEFVNLWKQMVPLLRIPVEGKTRHFDTTATSLGKTVDAKGVQRPGMKIISLNASAKHKRDIRLA